MAPRRFGSKTVRGRDRVLELASYALFAMALVGCGRQPQLGTDDGVWGEIEALYTAVNSPSRTDLLSDSEARLEQLYAAGRLNDQVHGVLVKIIQDARRGERRSAAERLYALMRAQRR